MDTTSESQVIASENSLLEAMKTNNVERLDALLHDDLLFNGPSGVTATKATDLQNYRSGNIHLHTVAASDQTLHVIGDTAVVAVTVELKGNYLGQALDGKFRYIRVWKLAESTWKVIAGSVVPLSFG
ncbi:MAG: nuclear transport factor 2 family protein [Roseiflexaceae bacterium]